MSDQRAAAQFPLVDKFHGIRMGVDLSGLRPGALTVVESPRRLQREKGYGYIRALWWLWLDDGRSAVSVPPGAGKAVQQIAENIRGIGRNIRAPERILDPALAEQLTQPVNTALRAAVLGDVDRVVPDLCFACHGSLLQRHFFGDCRRLTDESIPAAEDLTLPMHCFPDGVAYGVVADGKVVSVACSHRTGVMEDLVADLGIVTAEAYRRRGCAKTAVSALAEHFIRAGGEARYVCSPGNLASIATARSVGFVPYGASLVLSAPGPIRSDWLPCPLP